MAHLSIINKHMFNEGYMNQNPNIGNSAEILTKEEALEQKLLEDNMIVEIRRPTLEDVSHNGLTYREYFEKYIKEKGLTTQDRQSKYLEGLIKYVESPYIIDKFGDEPDAHIHRRKWRNEMGEKDLELRKFYENNKLKYNNLLGIVESARMKLLKSLNTENESLREKLVEQIDQAGYKEYHMIPLEKKIEVAQLVDKLAKQMLEDSII